MLFNDDEAEVDPRCIDCGDAPVSGEGQLCAGCIRYRLANPEEHKGCTKCPGCRAFAALGLGQKPDPTPPAPVTPDRPCASGDRCCAGPDQPFPCAACDARADRIPTAPEGVPITMAELVEGRL